MSLEVNGKQYEVDEEGYLANLNDWDGCRKCNLKSMALLRGKPLGSN